MEPERRANQSELLEKVTRIDERVETLRGHMEEVRADVKALRFWVNMGRGALAAAVAIGGWIGFNGIKNG